MTARGHVVTDRERASKMAWQAAHREEARIYREAHREQHRVYAAAWHVAHRDENKARSAAYYRAHRQDPDARREEKAAYQAAHAAERREEKRTKRAAYRAAHRAEISAYNAAYTAARRDEMAARYLAYDDAHRDRRRVAMATYRSSHPERARENYQKDRVRRAGAAKCDHLGCLTLGPVQLAWQTSEHRCYLCGMPLWQGAKPGDAGHVHMDHVIPIARGGLHCAENLRPACAPCNQRKGARLIEKEVKAG